MSAKLVRQVKAAFRVSTPIVQINTTDQEQTLQAIVKELCDGTTVVQWDFVRGFRARNKFSADFVRNLVGGDDESIGNPVIALEKMLDELPKKAVVFLINAHLWLDQEPVRQAIWNIRDAFKRSRRMLVLLCPDHTLPSELAGDVVVLDEPLPERSELDGLVRTLCGAAKVEVDDATVERAVEAIQGLPAFQAEQVVAMSLSRDGLDIDALWDRKRKQIEQTPGLSVNREGVTFEDIGGVSEIKEYVARIMAGKSKPGAVVFLDEIEKMLGGAQGDTSGVTQDQLGSLLSYMEDNSATGLIFVGPPGCLSGDTEVLYRRGKRNSSRRLSLQKLHAKFNGLPVAGSARGEATPWHKECDTYLQSYDHGTGRVFYNRIVSVLSSGVKPCYEVSLSSGERLVATGDHPVLTPDGFVRVDELSPGSVVVCRGSMKARKTGHCAPRAERMTVRNLKYYSSGCVDAVTDPRSGKTYQYRRQTRARLVFEAKMNGLSYAEYVTALRTDPQAVSLQTLCDGIELHHKNGNAMDDRFDNLQPLTKAEHTVEHDPLSRFNVEYTDTAIVESVNSAGDRETYDVQMASPANNFCTAGGVFVHNTAKSVVAKAAGNSGGVPTIALDLGGAKGSLVGQSEQQLRTALKVISAAAGVEAAI